MAKDPINQTDDTARKQVRDLLAAARFAALAVLHPDTGMPYVARTGLLAIGATPHVLISSLSLHTRALQTNPACSLLIGEPGPKGDPLTHPRMTLTCTAQAADKAALKHRWLAAIPKATLYYDFNDFQMLALIPTEIHLNGGFGKAYRLTPEDLT